MCRGCRRGGRYPVQGGVLLVAKVVKLSAGVAMFCMAVFGLVVVRLAWLLRRLVVLS